MAEETLTPKSPGKTDAASKKTVAVRVSKKKLAKKRMAKKKMAKKRVAK